MQYVSTVVYIFSILFVVTVSETGSENVKYDPFYDAFIGLSTPLTQVVGKDGRTDHLVFKQTLDHFSKSKQGTWEQHYAMNKKYYNSGGPAILFLTAQHSSPNELIEDDKYPVVQYAKELKAALFMLEHRYFGLSQPFKSLTEENLKYLTTRQAVEDVAAFIPFANKEHKLGEETKWIVIGGSYAGNLAAWVRQIHPELVVGAVASSAPMKIALDIPDYLAGLEKVLQKEKNCVANLKESFAHAAMLCYDADGRKNLSKVFRLEPTISETPHQKELQFFFAILQAYFKGGLEYVEASSTTGANIKKVCDKLRKKDHLERLLDAVSYFAERREKPLEKIKNNYEEFVKNLKENGTEKPEQASRRSWLWLKCNELGLFQSTDYGKGAFGSTVPLGFWIEMCTDIFGEDFQIGKIAKAVEATREYYSVRDEFNGTNVVFINNRMDPWFPLGISEWLHETVTLLSVENTTHCGDLLPGSPDASTRAVRKLSVMKMKRWLTQETEPRREKTTIFVDIPHPNHPLSLIETIKKEGDIEEFTIEQPVDHFNLLAKNKFKQHFWSYSKFHKLNGPRFLMIGGHSPASTMWLNNSKVQIMKLAEKFGAAVYLIEHRGYGKSSLNWTDLKYVTSKQMIVDVEQLIKAVNEKEKTPYKWITFGGGYGGSIAAWSRMFRPELVIGAVASSAPVSPVLDFYNYLLNLQNIIEKRDGDCKRAMDEIFEELNTQLLDKQSRANLSETLSMNPQWTVDSKPTPTDIQFFYLNLLSHFIAAVQFDRVNMKPYNKESTLEKACSILKLNKSMGSKLKDFIDYVSRLLGKKSTAFPNSYRDFVLILSDMQTSYPELRTCFYQQCTEFGLFRTTDIGRNTFKSALPLNIFEELCTDVFGPDLTWKDITQFVSEAADLFRENDDTNLENVVLTYGKVDPWTTGEPKKTHATVFTIEGAAHMADMYPERTNDSESLKTTRKRVEEILAEWTKGGPLVTEAPRTTTTTTTTDATTTMATTTKRQPAKPQRTTTKTKTTSDGAAVSAISFVLLTVSAAVFFTQIY
ncbi:hypothetical protein AB6A40_002386 [Gnathostoma spinigerum]|uniref:Uncharacterized protein n=1 Tax=Gnathostoma spinigerum TaxID=75299 RepID=A0ABD6EG61_9BILA